MLLTALIRGAAVVGSVQRLAAGARLALLLRALHAVARRARAALARARSGELVPRHVHHVPQRAAPWKTHHKWVLD